MTKREAIKAAVDCIDDIISTYDADNPLIPYFLGQAYAYLIVALGGEKEDT